MRVRSLVTLAALLAAGCATAPPAATLADGRVGRIAVATETLPLAGGGPSAPATVTATLSLPAGAGRVPAVILVHGCGGEGESIGAWARELTAAGYAALALDSFTGRGLAEICSGRERLGVTSRLLDAYRALALLATHPRVDRERIALMGFSHGGWVALWAAHRQFARRFKPEGAPDFAAYLPVYPAGCFIRLQDEASLVGGPVRIFAGGADDWTPAAPCREWAARVSAAGRAASFVEYEGAPHAFDNPRAGPTRRLPHVLSAAGCVGIQQRDGRVLDPDGRPLGIDSPCLGRGASIGYDPQAHRRLIADAKAFLDAALRGTSSAR